MNNIKQLKDRCFDKEIKLYNVNSKYDLISKVIDVLNKFLPEDINKVIVFKFNLDTTLPLSNGDFYIKYKGLETTDEYKNRLAEEQTEKDKKVVLLNRLASELDYKLERINE